MKLFIFAAVFVVEALIARMYFDYIYAQKTSDLKTGLYFAFGYSFLFLISCFNVILLNGISFFIINFIILSQNYSCKIKSVLFHTVFLTIVMLISEVIIVFVMARFVDVTAYLHNMSTLAALSTLSKLLYFLLSVLASRLFTPHKEGDEAPSLFFLLFVLPLTSLALGITTAYIGITENLSQTTETMLAISVVLLLFANLAILFVYNMIQKAERANADLQMTIARERAADEYYEMLQKQYEGQRILIHDIKNHLTTVDGMAERGESEEVRKYISELYNLPSLKLRGKLCNHPVLNMILLRHSEYCAENNISFSCDVRSKSTSFMDDASITALFGNLLSNAVHAAETSKERFVEVKVTKKEQLELTLISVVNSCDNAPETDSQGNLISRSGRGPGHGYGTKSIDRVVKKYGGSQEQHYDKELKEFHIIICFRKNSVPISSE